MQEREELLARIDKAVANCEDWNEALMLDFIRQVLVDAKSEIEWLELCLDEEREKTSEDGT